MRRVPPFPLLGEPGDWDRLTLLAGTIRLEAEGEPEAGQLGVGYVVMNRVIFWKLDLHAVILGPDRRAYQDNKPFEPFSCWNSDYQPMAEARLAGAGEAAESAWRAAAAALWHLLPDPTHGAIFYLNVDLTKRLRHGTLPDWAADPHDPTLVHANKVKVVLGRHTFLV